MLQCELRQGVIRQIGNFGVAKLRRRWLVGPSEHRGGRPPLVVEVLFRELHGGRDQEVQRPTMVLHALATVVVLAYAMLLGLEVHMVSEVP